MATLNEVATKITEIDAKQDKEIAVLTHKVEDLEKTVDEFRTRIRKNERLSLIHISEPTRPY